MGSLPILNRSHSSTYAKPIRVNNCLEMEDIISDETLLLCKTLNITELIADEMAGPDALPCNTPWG